MVHLEIDSKSRVAVVTLSRPEKRNALNAELVGQLTEIFESLSADVSCRVVILTGSGNTFSAGADLKALAAMQVASYEENEKDSRALAQLFVSIRSCSKPVIARVNGHAIAGGMGLLLACDYAIATRGSKFGFPETRIGMVPAIVAVFLRERVGTLVQRDLLLRGHLVDSDEAQNLGLVNTVVESDNLDQAVAALSTELIYNTSPQAVAATKLLLHDISNETFEAALDRAVSANARAREADDCRDGITAFLNKTDPPWKDRP